ncbi:sensor domain-containing protein [Streptomyces sp. NPDC004111]|uniref:sensor domain-containing protein n=1 Tax=Streptomyces sp. NPDC004111 TaxID=3364690 RepID=UPI00369AA137
MTNRLRAGRRLPHRSNPFRMLLSAATWRATGYLAGHLVAGPALFVVTAAALLIAFAFSQFTLTVALTIGSAWAVRCCAQVERGRAVLVDAPIPHAYRTAAEPGLSGHLNARFTDPVLYRDLAYLVLAFPFLLLVDALVLALWLPVLAGAALPLWFWSITNRQTDGSLREGVRLGASDGSGPGIWIDSWPAALLASAVFLVVAMYAAYAVVAAARLNLTVAHVLLRPPRDPLAAAKRVLAGPGPLGPALPEHGPAPATEDAPAEDASGEGDGAPAGRGRLTASGSSTVPPH